MKKNTKTIMSVIMTALLCCQLVFAAPVSSFGAERLTVSAVSNIFDSFFASFDAATERITVTYFVQSSEWKILNAQWTLTYDPEYLELDDAEDVNYTIDDDVAIGYMMPFAGDDGVYNIDDPGAVVANTSKLNGYRIKEKDGSKVGFVSATFKPLKAGSTVVSLDAEVVTLKKGETEIKVVDGSRITDETISFIPEKTKSSVYEGYYDSDVENPESAVAVGDVNGDGLINIDDVTMIQRYLVKSVDLDTNVLAAADTNRDGRIDIRDATRIQKYIAQLITEFY